MPEDEKPAEEFETFFWCGQKRYRCNLQWENGTSCAYDTYDLGNLRAHLSQPHTRSGSRAAANKPAVSPILDDSGKPIRYDAEPLDPTAFQYRFRNEG